MTQENTEALHPFLYLEGRPEMPRKTQKNFHLLLPEKLVETIEQRVVSPALNTSFVVLIQAGLDLLKRRRAKFETDFIVDAEKDIKEGGVGLDQSLKDNLSSILATPPKREFSRPVLYIKRRMGSFARREFTLILPQVFAKEIDDSTSGPRNSGFLILLALGLEVFRFRSEDGKKPVTIKVTEFFKTHWYESEISQNPSTTTDKT